jgi:chemotaxis protein CheX
VSERAPGSMHKFPVDEKPEYNLVRLTNPLSPDAAKSFTLAMPTIVGSPAKNVVLDCEQILDIPVSWIRALMSLSSKLKAAGKGLRLIAVKEALAKFIKREGLDASLRVSESLVSALAEMHVPSAQVLDVAFINPFLEATVTVLETQTMTLAKPGKLLTSKTRHLSGEISGVISLESDAFIGTVAISFPAATFLKLIGRMLGEEYTEITKDIEDGAAEITNMIYGQAKVKLNEKGYALKTALPSVAAGTTHSVAILSQGPHVLVTFTTDVGEFFVEIFLRN